MITYEFLQNYWWLLISILGAVLVFLLFVQGGQTLLPCSKDESFKSLILASLGKRWELTFTTLVVFGGAFFASFPLFYSTSFGGAYWLWMLILFTFVIQAVSYKYRTKEGNIYGKRFYDTLLTINGYFAPLLLGIAVGTIFFGADFTVAKSNILNTGASTISQWGDLHGLEAIFNLKNLTLGLTVLFLSKVMGSLYLINNIRNDAAETKIRKHLLIDSVIFVLFFLTFVVILFTSSGVEYDTTGQKWIEYKYLDNLFEMWWCLILLLLGTAAVLIGIAETVFKKDYRKGIWVSGIGAISVVLVLFWIAGYNNTAYYPSLIDVNSSLTIRNSSSSEFTLTAMSIVSLLIPFVIAYIAYAWHSLDKHKITEADTNEKY